MLRYGTVPEPTKAFVDVAFKEILQPNSLSVDSLFSH